MFPFWCGPCGGSEPLSHKNYRENKLKFLKVIRDELEARLAGLNAAIETIERQLSREDAS
jgi:uncharacterized small protein (DUF1192 family)